MPQGNSLSTSKIISPRSSSQYAEMKAEISASDEFDFYELPSSQGQTPRKSGGGSMLSQGLSSQGTGLTDISTSVLHLIEEATSRPERSISFDELSARSTSPLSPNALREVLENLQVLGYIYKTGAEEYTLL